jgi:hypothetical protein
MLVLSLIIPFLKINKTFKNKIILLSIAYLILLLFNSYANALTDLAVAVKIGSLSLGFKFGRL